MIHDSWLLISWFIDKIHNGMVKSVRNKWRRPERMIWNVYFAIWSINEIWHSKNVIKAVMIIHFAPVDWIVYFTLNCFSFLLALYLLQKSWIVRAAVISAERSSSLAARYVKKVAVIFWSGIVLLMSADRMSIGTPPSSLVCGKLAIVFC